MPESDEIPVADAVEQQQETAAPVTDEEASVGLTAEMPLETSDADWQEQHEEILDDPEERAADLSSDYSGEVLAPDGGETLPG